MAIVTEKTADFASFIGSPNSLTVYDVLDFGFKSIFVKIIVSAGTLNVSLNKSDANPHMVLVTGQYDFPALAVKKLFVRQTGATAQILAWAD